MKAFHLYVSTVLRETISQEYSGYLFKIEWPSKKVIKFVSIPAKTNTVKFWNERGGNRGGRGVFVKDGIVYLATSISLLKYDEDLNLLGEIKNPKLSGLHEIFVEDDGIWINSTLHDLMIKLDFKGKSLIEWYGSECKRLQKKLKYRGRKLNTHINFPKKNYHKYYRQYMKTERLHLNTVQVIGKSVYAFACRKKALIRIFPKPVEVIFQDRKLGAPHNGLLVSGKRFIVNDTAHHSFKIYNTKTGKLIKNIVDKNASCNKTLATQFSTPGWQRGLCNLGDGRYIAGTSPLTIFEIDSKKGKVIDYLKLSDDVTHCSFSIFAVPL